MTILIYQKIPAKEIRKGAKQAIRDITKWFENNPTRKVCRVQGWYGKTIHVKRKTVAEQVNAAADEAIHGEQKEKK